ALVALLADPDPSFRRQAIDTLGGMGARAKAALPDLVERCADEDSHCRVLAALAVWQVDKNKEVAVPVLAGALSGGTYGDRQRAAEALRKMGEDAGGALPELCA